jgi:predicted ester cyclase
MAGSETASTESAMGNGENARYALESVCSGAGLDHAGRCYGPSFVDHVNDVEFRGLEGVEQSVRLYRKALKNVSIEVQEQVVDGESVCSRYVVKGRCVGRQVSFNGMTLSRFENGLIVEDWSVVDTLGLLRRLGILRSLVVGMRLLTTYFARRGVTDPSIAGAQKWCAWGPRRSRSATRAR